MLLELHIEDLGIIDRLDLVFGAGLTVFTGETGAGKTMLVEAISLLVGGRADTGRIRTGALEARVEGRFVTGDEEVVLCRVVPVDGRSRAYVNGRLATVTQLAELGQKLVDLHGQHTHQSLLSASVQRAALDEFAHTDLQPLREARARLTEIDASLAALGGDTRVRAREIDLLRFQVEEILGAGVSDPSEETSLEIEEDVLADATAHRHAAQASVEAINEDGGALDLLGSAIAALQQRAPFEAEVMRLRDLIAEIADASGRIRHIGEACEDDPERLSEVRERRQSLREVRRKYGESLTDVLAYLDESQARLEELESFEVRVEALEEQRLTVARNERSAAKAVAKVRRAAAPALGKAITAHLGGLAMERAVVEIVVTGDDPADEVLMMLTANPGTPPAPLSKIASGGELARTMLAIRLVLTQGPPVLVFDEVDAGIGGAAANSMAASLARLAKLHQIFVVTHLAQVAAVADQQVAVSKEVVTRSGSEVTIASASPVAGSHRVDEIARMLSGRPDSAAARRHAKELLESSSITP
jgi:DNA repair protein RecN (Recombination protein N)